MTLLEFPAAAAGTWIIAPGAPFIAFHRMSIDASIEAFTLKFSFWVFVATSGGRQQGSVRQVQLCEQEE